MYCYVTIRVLPKSYFEGGQNVEITGRITINNTLKTIHHNYNSNVYNFFILNEATLIPTGNEFKNLNPINVPVQLSILKIFL